MTTLETMKVVLAQAIENQVFPGCSVAVIKDGKVQARALGTFTYEAESPRVTTDTRYDCASLTKIVGPMAVAGQLLDEGIITMADLIGKYLPEFVTDDNKAEAAIKHLLTYTLDFDIPGGSKSLMGILTPAQVAHNAITYPLKYAPGTNYLYSNITSFLLTQVIERVTGRNFYELVNERIFTPLQMHSATFSVPDDVRHTIPPTEVTDYRGVVQGIVHDEFTDFTTRGGISNGAAGLFASVGDVATFLQMSLNDGVHNGKRLFSEELVAEWTSDQFPELLPTHTPLLWGDFNNAYIDEYPEHQIIVKGGFTGCFMIGDLVSKRGFVLLSNRTYPKRPDDRTAFDTLKRDLVEVVF